MNMRDCETAEEVRALSTQLINEGNTVEIQPLEDGTFRAMWIKNKTYIKGGKEVEDEVWCTKGGELIVCQDLTPEHARNIVRMIVANSRDQSTKFSDLMEVIGRAFAEVADSDLDEDYAGMLHDNDTPRVLH